MTRLVRTKLDPITPNDLCDKGGCPQPALLAVLIADSNGMPVGTLMWCLHHGNEVDLSAVRVIDCIDNRGQFIESEVKPSSWFIGDWLLQD